MNQKRRIRAREERWTGGEGKGIQAKDVRIFFSQSPHNSFSVDCINPSCQHPIWRNAKKDGAAGENRLSLLLPSPLAR